MNARHVWLALVLAFAAACPARADLPQRQQATQAALDAFFSMEAVQPEGSERQPPPEGFENADGTGATEEKLIVYLARQKQLGADLNSYRHLGTPLHHAIRSGLHATARWLLKNGADPRLRIRDEGTPFQAPDALGVAVSVGAWDLFDQIRRLPAYQALSAPDLTRATWPYAMDAADKSAALLSKGIALPGFSSAPELADALLRHSLCTGQPRLALALLRQPDAPPAPATVRQPGAPCPVMNHTKAPVLAPLRAADWQVIEEKLQWPVLPFLAARAQTAPQAAQWLAAGLRSPWSEPVAVSQYIWGALRVPLPAALALLREVPAAPLQAALREQTLMLAWLTAAANWPLADLHWALAQVDAGPLIARLTQVMKNWSYAPATRREATDGKDRIARWALLTDRLDAPLPVVQDDGFLYWVPIELWPRWFKLGYRVDDRHWADWLAWVDPVRFEQAWPEIAQHQPAVAQRALLWLVAPLSVGPVDDPQARRLSYTGGYLSDADFLRKVKYLQAQGVRLARPRWLAAAHAGPTPEPGIAFALGQQWVRQPPAALRSQLTRAPLDCRPRPSAALRRSLAFANPIKGEGGQDFEMEAIQPIAQLGEADCAWLASASSSGGRRFINDESFSEGVQRLTPCTEGSASAVLWNNARGAWVEVASVPEGALVPVRLKTGGDTAFVVTEGSYGTCGDRPGGLVLPRFSADGALALEPLGPGHTLFDALVLQCNLREVSACFLGEEEKPAHPADALTLPAFVDKAWSQEKAGFLAAIDRLDRTALARTPEDGVFANWLDDALRRIGASTALALPEKRQRIAWVLAHRTPRPTFAPETLDALLPWLPVQDWGPIVATLRCSRRDELARLATQTQEQHLTALHRRLHAALAAVCEH